MNRDEEIEAVVIGSGFGGAVAALRLGEAGIPTIVLERGKRWPLTEAGDTFATYDHPDGRAAWLSSHTIDPVNPGVPIDVHTGVLDRRSGNGVATLCGAGVGGGSLIFTGMMAQPTREGFMRVLPHLDYDQFVNVYYPRVRSIVHSSPIPSDVLADPHFELMCIFLAMAEKAHLSTGRLDMALDWEIVRQEMSGERKPQLLTGQQMWYGINAPIKQSLDRNYLAQAEATGRVAIRPLHEVTSIEAVHELGGERYRIVGRRITPSGEEQEPFSLTCRTLFVAAGSVGTSELFVRAKAQGTLPRLNDEVGCGWGNNGDVICLHPTIQAQQQVPQLPGGVGAFLPHLPAGSVTLLADAAGSNLVTLAITLPSQEELFNRGHFLYDDQTGHVVLHWPREDSPIPQQLTAAQLANERISENRDAQNAHANIMLNADLATHPLGGMLLGKACALDGRVRGYKNLYVIDGSLLPGSAGGVNPALTIAALAEYLMEGLCKR